MLNFLAIPRVTAATQRPHNDNEQTKIPRAANTARWSLQTGFYSGMTVSQNIAHKLTHSAQDVAESLGITSLLEPVISSLTSDVEYRIHQVVEVRLMK